MKILIANVIYDSTSLSTYDTDSRIDYFMFNKMFDVHLKTERIQLQLAVKLNFLRLGFRND